MKSNRFQFEGLSPEAVEASRARHGVNSDTGGLENSALQLILEIAGEPLFLLLAVTTGVYFWLGQNTEAWLMIVSMGVVALLSFIQIRRSRNAVDALRKLTAPSARVVRAGTLIEIPAVELVVGDMLLIQEGDLVPADAVVVEAHDCMVNEAAITGESFPVEKSADGERPHLYKGSVVVSGQAYACVEAVGSETQLGRIGVAIKEIKPEKTPLQRETARFVRIMVAVGSCAFLLVWAVDYARTGSVLQGFLHGLTMAMALLPEEIPVSMSTYLALGAYRLLRKGVIAKYPQTVEALGAATVICTDKTGTITENTMDLAGVYDLRSDTWMDKKTVTGNGWHVLEHAVMASEPEAFDPMERALHDAYTAAATTDRRPDLSLIKEYALEGKPPRMAHVYREGALQGLVMAAKGAKEAFRADLTDDAWQQLERAAAEKAILGQRILAIARGTVRGDEAPRFMHEIHWEVLGLVAFYDPPKQSIETTIHTFYEAGIDVKMITGDYPDTAMAIARQAGMRPAERCLTGAQIIDMDDDTLQQEVQRVNVFARMFPEAKLRIINALKTGGEIVAMTGDGINDGPALKSAHIGIAMGKRGTETAKSTATLILIDDDLAHMTDAIAFGRRIYDNLKKAIAYIIAIHLPIIGIVALPLILGWQYPYMFFPVHVIFLELVMDPTCALVFESEPLEPGAMRKPPRPRNAGLINLPELAWALLQGAVVLAACLSIGYYHMAHGDSEQMVRTMVFSTFILSNILLTLINRSKTEALYVFRTDQPQFIALILSVSLLILLAAMYVPAVSSLFQIVPLSLRDWALCLGAAVVSTLWMEGVKWRRRCNMQQVVPVFSKKQ